jgi:hypothetical protein
VIIIKGMKVISHHNRGKRERERKKEREKERENDREGKESKARL